MPGSTLAATTQSLRRCSSRLAGVLVTPLASSSARECSSSMDTVFTNTVLVEAHHAYPPWAVVRYRGGSPLTRGEPPPAPPAHVRRRVGVGRNDDGGEPVDPQPVLSVRPGQVRVVLVGVELDRDVQVVVVSEGEQAVQGAGTDLEQGPAPIDAGGPGERDRRGGVAPTGQHT